jgi:hypothetical protein
MIIKRNEWYLLLITGFDYTYISYSWLKRDVHMIEVKKQVSQSFN